MGKRNVYLHHHEASTERGDGHHRNFNIIIKNYERERRDTFEKNVTVNHKKVFATKRIARKSCGAKKQAETGKKVARTVRLLSELPMTPKKRVDVP